MSVCGQQHAVIDVSSYCTVQSAGDVMPPTPSADMGHASQISVEKKLFPITASLLVHAVLLNGKGCHPGTQHARKVNCDVIAVSRTYHPVLAIGIEASSQSCTFWVALAGA